MLWLIRIPAFAQNMGEDLHASRKRVNPTCIHEIGGPSRLEPPVVAV